MSVVSYITDLYSTYSLRTDSPDLCMFIASKLHPHHRVRLPLVNKTLGSAITRHQPHETICNPELVSVATLNELKKFLYSAIYSFNDN